MSDTDQPIRCTALVWRRDTLRYCGGKQRFRMHYNKTQCRRKAVVGTRCFQHRWEFIPECPFATQPWKGKAP